MDSPDHPTRQASATAALGLAGNLTVDHPGGPTVIAYAAGDTLTTIAASVTAALAAENITASRVNVWMRPATIISAVPTVMTRKPQKIHKWCLLVRCIGPSWATFFCPKK